jgi:hypothetical protein
MQFKTIAWSSFDTKGKKQHSCTHYLQTRFEQEALTLCGKVVPLDVHLVASGIGFCNKCNSAAKNLRLAEARRSKNAIREAQSPLG